LPADVNLRDPYFAEELSKQDMQVNGMSFYVNDMTRIKIVTYH